MKKMVSRVAVVLVGVAAMSMAAQARAATLFTFGQDVQRKNFNTDISWIRNTTTKTGGVIESTNQGGAAGGSPVTFTFTDPSLGALSGHGLSAVFKLTGFVPSPTPATDVGGLIVQGGVQGSFSFVYQGGPATYGGITLHNGDDLLTATFAGGVISGMGTSGSLTDSTSSGGTIAYTSDFLKFYNGLPADFSFGLSSVTPSFTLDIPGRAMKSFDANSTGTFSTAAVPEPASWALSLVGFGLLGGAVRRRRGAPAKAISSLA